MEQELQKSIEFLKETDKMKAIYRQNTLLDRSRREDDAAHSWHCAVMAMTLAPYAKPEVDIDRAVQMLLMHDLVEIYAGDTPCYDVDVVATQEAREAAAAQKLLDVMPAALADTYKTLWAEFSQNCTPTAQYAVTVDRLQPLFLNYFTDGASWESRTVTRAQVLKRNAIAKETLPALYPTILKAIDTLTEKGLLEP